MDKVIILDTDMASAFAKIKRLELLNLTFKDAVKNNIKQPNQCMACQNISALAIDLLKAIPV